jgi:hypothetical protein
MQDNNFKKFPFEKKQKHIFGNNAVQGVNRGIP